MRQRENWDDPINPEDSKELDMELIHELNFKDTESEAINGKAAENEEMADFTWVSRKRALFRVIGFFVAVAFLAAIWSNWFRIINALPLDFLAKSHELSKEPGIRKLQQAVVRIEVSGSQGSGFNINSGGLIITNEHVVAGAQNAGVTFSDGTYYSGKVLVAYPDIDLAVIKIAGRDLPSLELKPDSAITPDMEVLIIGNPLGFTDVVTRGRVTGSVKAKGWDVPVIMIAGEIRSGSSGSPVLNNDGHVIAVVFGSLVSDKGKEKGQMSALAVPVKYLDRFFWEQGQDWPYI
ncbi:S1C family serine protease [Phosphitispora sp. TUW77]|uniref:S1C family serine protease n=1 Tax=Phosphitispora sp. TUW77 TaxID=3152361 RepID=UPI003AB68375